MKIAILGGGNMGQAIVTAFLKKKIATPGDLLVFNRTAAKNAFFKAQKITVLVGAQNFVPLRQYDVIFLAVKPQDMTALLDQIRDFLPPKALVISIAAGVTLRSLERLLGSYKIVRCLPNTPAQIQQGITEWTANKKVTSSDRKVVRTLLGAFGEEIYFDDESMIDAACTISGCGPAYVFYFIEALMDGGRRLGLDDDTCLRLATQTFLGATLLLKETGESPTILRQKVTSKKGVTEQALKHMDSKKVSRAISDALQKAYKRCKELNI